MTATADHADPAPASGLPARRPGAHHPGTRRPVGPRPEPPAYDVDAAWQLLADTCELPATERGLLKVLTQYRRALHDLLTHLQARDGQQPAAPGNQTGRQP